MNSGKTFIYLFVFGLLAVAAGMPVFAGEPPEIEKGWNLISVTCDVSIEQFKQNLGSGEIEVFSWDGEKYVKVDRLLRGYGYILNSNAVLNSSNVCGGQTEVWNTKVSIRRGWNLLGNPYHKAAVIADLLGEQADSFADLMFEYQGNKYREITKTDEIKVWRAVWVYSYSDQKLEYVPGCEELGITLEQPETPELDVGAQAAFRAMCRVSEAGGESGDESCGEAAARTDDGGENTCGGWSGYVDVTSEAQWTLANPDVLSPGEPAGAAPGVFTAGAPGTCGVSAGYSGKVSNTITVMVKEPPAPVLVSIKLSADRTELRKEETAVLTVTGVYSDGTAAEVTGQAVFGLSAGGVGDLEGNRFVAMSPGSVTISATVEALSDSLEISVKEPEPQIVLEALELYVYPRAIEIYETAVFYVYARYSDGRFERANASVEWVYDPAMGRIENTGTFYPAALGTLAVKAVKDGIESNTVNITILEKQLIWVGIYPEPHGGLRPLPCPDYYGYLFCYTNSYIKVEETGRFFAVADYNNSTRNIVTDSVEKWETTDDTVLSVSEGGHVTPHKIGTAGVRAYKEGVYSEWAWVQVVDDSTREFLLLEYSNRETILQPGGTAELNATYYSRPERPLDPYEVHNNMVEDGMFTALRVTPEAAWTVTEPAVGTFDAEQGVFKGKAPGRSDVSAGYAGLDSNSVEMEVWKPEEFSFCEGAEYEASWTDNMTVARLAVGCNKYKKGAQVDMAFDALLSGQESRGVLDVCLDLYIYNSDHVLVKTMRHENCSPTPLFRTLENYTPVYNYTRTWDQMDDNGEPVPPGDYIAVARFYVLYCPVLKVPFTILAD